MSSVGTVISFPIPAYANLPIESQFYQPSRFLISALTRGNTTLITTSTNHNYVIGQNVRLLIPTPYGSFQLNETEGYVLDVPAANQVTVGIDSTNANAFVASPYSVTISNATQTNPVVLTIATPLTASLVLITGVSGMTELNGNIYQILSGTATTRSIDVDGFAFNAYTSGGTASTVGPQPSQAQILAIGDINSGVINTNGRTQNQTYINGSFIDISPN